MTRVTEVLGNTFVNEMGQRSDDTRVVMYKSLVKVCKHKEGLNILDLLRLRPVLSESPEDFLDMLLVGGHVSRVDEGVIQV